MRTIFWVAAAAYCLMAATPAMARHAHRHYHYHHRHHARAHVIPDVLVANPYGDVIVDGKTGFHRSDWGIMVPDSEPQSFVATGRASGSGFGASGIPGQNWQ